MRCPVITLGVLLATAAAGCADKPAPGNVQVAQQSSRAAASARADSASRTAQDTGDSAVNTALVAVVREAYGMAEASSLPAWSPDSAARVQRRLPYYSRLFGDSLARVFAEYDGSERIMFPPDSIVVLRVAGDDAEVAYPTPIMLKEIWGRPDYTTDRLHREHGHWRIVSSRGSAEKPAGVTAPPT